MLQDRKRKLELDFLSDREIMILSIKESEEIKRELKIESDKNNTSSLSKVINNNLVNTLSKAEEVLLNYIYK